jgi:hypothetical protein
MFSVKLTNGQNTFTKKHADLAVVDRLEYGEALAGTTRVLDFSIKEVRTYRSVLLAFDLERQHLSALVEEMTTVQDGMMIPGLRQTFKSKAYALFRYVPNSEVVG